VGFAGLPVVLSLGVFQGAQRLGIQGACPTAAAEHAQAKGSALLLGEDDRLKGKGVLSVFGRGPQDLKGCDHAEDAVVVAPARNAVEMRAGQPAGGGPGDGFLAEVDVARGIEAMVAAHLGGLGDDVVPGLAPGRGEGGAIRSLAWVRGAGGDRLNVPRDPLGVDGHRRIPGMD